MAIKFLDDTAQAAEVAQPQGTIKFLDAPAAQADPAPTPAPEVDDFQAVQKTDFDRIKNVYFTDGELQAMKDKGPIGFLEARKFVDPVKLLPGANMATEIYETGELANIAIKLNKEEALSDSEKSRIDEHFKTMIEQEARGFTWGGGMMNYGATMPASMIEFAASFGIGRAATKGVTVAATKVAEKIASKALQKAAIKTAQTSAVIGATMAAAPQIYIPNYNERQIANNLAITDKGELLLRDSDEAPAVTALKTFGDTFTEVASEMSGAALGKYIVGPMGKFVSKPIKSAFERLPVDLRDKLFEGYRAIQPDAKIKEMFTKAGFHGAIEEMGEERVADIMKVSLGLNEEDKPTAEKFMDALYPGKDQLMLEAGLFATTGGAMRGASMVKNMLIQKGATPEEADDTVKNLSALEIDKAFEDLTVPETKESLLRVKDKAYQLAKSAGVKDEEAQASAKVLMGQALWGSKQYGVTPEAYFDNLKLDIRNATPKARTAKELKRMLNEEPDVSGIFPKFYKEAAAYLKSTKLTAKQRGKSLSTFIKGYGGIYDVGGDLKSRDIGSDLIRLTPEQRAQKGLEVKQSRGQTKNLENMKQAAFDAGYFPDAATYEDVTNDMFREAIERDYNGDKIYPGVQSLDDSAGLFQQYDEVGLTPDMSIEQAAGLIQEYFIEKELPLEDVQEQPGDLYQAAPKTDSEAFKKWFGDSKVVDKDGKPKAVFHGTAKKFESFNFDNAPQKIIWFASDRTDIDAGEIGAQGRGTVLELYAKIENPAGWVEYDKYSLDELQQQGYDGVILPEKDGTFNGFVFEPTQVKSVNNRGTFDANDPRILNQDNRGSISFEDGGKTVIRLFEMADSSTLFHELGHMFLRELRTAADISPEAKKQFEAIKENLGSQDGNFTREQEEQFARNFEQYLMEGSSPSKYLRDAFESMKEMMIQVYQTVMSLGGTLNNETRAVMDQLVGGKDLDVYLAEVKIDNTESIWGKFYRDWVDDLAPIETITKAFEAMRGKLPEGTNPNFLARLFAATKGRIVENVQNQTFYVDQDGNSVITGEGFKPILDDFDVEFEKQEPDYETRSKDLKDYLIARRYIEDLKDREDVEVSARQEAESAAIMAKLSLKYGSEFVRFDSYAKRIYEFEKRILFNLVRSGIMSQENFDKITGANKNYVPFQRVFEEEEISDGFVITGKGKFEGKSALSIVKKISGSDREVNDVFENIIRSTARTIQAAYKNNVAASIGRMADAMPDNIKKVKAPMKPIQLEDGKTIFRPSGKPFGNIIEFYVDGKRQFVEVSKPLYEAMQGMHPGEITMIGKFFRGIASFFRAAATLPPDFWIRNFIRDVNQASVQSEAGIKPVDIVQGITAVMGKTELYHEWMRSGGSFNSYMNLDDNGMQEAMNELLRPQGKAMLYAKTLGVEALRDASGAVEAATRIAMFRRSKLAGSSSMRAALESRDGTLDFSRSGRAGKIANRYIPFLNAGIQGVDKLVRAFRKNPEVMTFRALATITLPSIVLTGYYLYGAPDDERKEFLEIPQWQKDMFWVFKVAGSWRRIPKPFSLGYAFGSLPERFMLWSFQGDKPETEGMWREFVLGLGGSLSPIQDVGTLMTPVGRIVVESASNYNFFSGRNIYPSWMDRLPAEERMTKATSETAKEIGEKLGVSPALVDNAIRGMLATTTPYVIGASDDIIKAVRTWNGEVVPEEAKRSADMMFVRGFSVRDPSGYQAVSTQNFFEKHKELEELHNSYTAKKGKQKQAFYEKHGDAIRKYKPMHNFKERIGDLGDRLDMIHDDPKMTSEAKVKQIKVIEDQILDVAKRANSWFNANKGKAE